MPGSTVSQAEQAEWLFICFTCLHVPYITVTLIQAESRSPLRCGFELTQFSAPKPVTKAGA
jgi:hypothetical protein